MSFFQCLGRTKESVQVQGTLKHFVTIEKFLWWGVVGPTPNPQAGGPPLVGGQRLLIQYVRSYPPYPEDFPTSTTWGRTMPWWQGTHLTWIHFILLLVTNSKGYRLYKSLLFIMVFHKHLWCRVSLVLLQKWFWTKQKLKPFTFTVLKKFMWSVIQNINRAIVSANSVEKKIVTTNCRICSSPNRNMKFYQKLRSVHLTSLLNFV
jgi:hypothetical protein